MALTKGFELDTLAKNNDPLLQFLFNGGVVRGQKLQRGKVLTFMDVIEERDEPGPNPNQATEEEIIRTYETVYLFSFLVPK